MLPTSKALKLYKTLSSTSTINCFGSDVQTEVGQMYDELRRLFETFQRNINKVTLYVKRKKFMHLQQMTLHDMFKTLKYEP